MAAIDKYKMGDKVFGKLHGWSPWPGLVLQRCSTKVEKYEVFFYGSYDVAELKPGMMYPYTPENITKFQGISKFSSRFKKALDEIQADVTSFVTAGELKQNGSLKVLALQVKTKSADSEVYENVPGVNLNKRQDGVAFLHTHGNGATSKAIENGSMLIDVENHSDVRQMLFEMQLEPKKSSDVDCTFRCYDGEIRVHAALFRNWLTEDSQNFLPVDLELNLKIWTISELAPIVILMYTVQPAMKLNVRAKQAFKKIQQYLSKTGFNINIPKIVDPVEPLDLELKFRCTRTSPRSGRKSFYYVVSSGTFLDACDECKFSGLAGDLKKHYLDIHGNGKSYKTN
ncbi:unnamed protein product [Allacma fusca]|uniref:PWWP domain-containing protein n=1 Tax=Allacma fusca TaxID=39272 RepID=A0A8J2LQV0_9HEXA|nr:unnamed protein product [Allacma fusca]